nr:MAG: hypothetical protein DIU62_00915 [Pseudomonadota bacterium]
MPPRWPAPPSPRPPSRAASAPEPTRAASRPRSGRRCPASAAACSTRCGCTLRHRPRATFPACRWRTACSTART